MKKTLIATLALLLLTISCAFATDIRITSVPSLMHPGKMTRFIIECEQSTIADIVIKDGDKEIYQIATSTILQEGSNRINYNAMVSQTKPLSPLEYTLVVKTDAGEVTAPFSVGEPAPIVTMENQRDIIVSGDKWCADISFNMDGLFVFEVEIDHMWESHYSAEVVTADSLPYAIDIKTYGKPLQEGVYPLRLSLKNKKGIRSNFSYGELHVLSSKEELEKYKEELAIKEQAERDAQLQQEAIFGSMDNETLVARASQIPFTVGEETYWTMPIGDMRDEDAIWKIMMQPITLLKREGYSSKSVYKVRKTPDASTEFDNVVGEVAYFSQGLHILETLDNGWTKVEAYNTSYGPDNRNRPGYGVTGGFIQGYVETKYLVQETPKTKNALLIDKLEQKAHIFIDGKHASTLLVSTGKATAEKPWNETPAGEFIIISRLGDFPSGNMMCDMGLRLNSGCAIHEVPNIEDLETGYKDYSFSEAVLGNKASSGCIRVQRKPNEQGHSMEWIWNNMPVGTKVLVWEDSIQYMQYPKKDLVVYYNKDGGSYYHVQAECKSISKRFFPLSFFSYKDLLTPKFSYLKPCPTCNAPRHPQVIHDHNQSIAQKQQ